MKNIISKINESKYIAVTITIFFSIISVLFVLHNGLILGHDLEYHLSRIDSIASLMKIGDFKALIHEGLNGYGYANGLCYSNIFLYFPALLVVLGINLINSYKIYVVLFSILTGLTMYYSVFKITKSKFSSMISAIVYVTCSYRICDVMVRAALGESLSFIFIPIIILGLYYLIYDDYKKFWVFSLGFVGLINCHLISTIMMMIVSIIFIIINYEKILNEPKRFIYLILSAILGLLLGAFFIFPMLEFYVRNNILIKSQSDQMVYSISIFDSLCGLPKFTTRFTPPGIGFIFVYFLYCRFKIKVKKNDDSFKFFDICNVIGIICLIIATSILPWTELSNYAGFIQFSWRMFVPVCAFLAFSAGIIFEKYIDTKKYKNFVVIMILVIIIVLSGIYQLLSVKSLKRYWPDLDNIYISELKESSIAAGEYMLVNTDWSLLDSDKREIKSNSGAIKTTFDDKGSIIYIEFENNDQVNTYIDVPQIYYRGFAAVNEKTNHYYTVGEGYNTWIRIYLENDKEGHIKLYYRGTRVLRYSYILSLISWIIFGFVLLRKRRATK